jgi:hypothetical protein
LVVRQHRDGLRAKEVIIPDAEQTHEHRQVARERRSAEMFVDRVEALEHGAEVFRADRKHGGKADCGVHRVASADPIPELEHVGGIDAEFRDLLGIRRDRDEMLGDRLGIAAEAAQRPIPRAVRVGHGLQRGEGLRRDDEQRLRRIEVARRLDEIRSVDVGHEPERHGAVAVVSERLVRHHRPEIGAADADVDHVANALSGMSFPLAAADAIGEVSHLVEHGMDLRDDILSVDDDRGSSRRAQRHVQDRAVFRDVDLLAAKHRIDPLAQAGLLRKRDEQAQCLLVDAVFRIIEEDAGGLGRHPLAPAGIAREQVPQGAVAHSLIVSFESLPCAEPVGRSPAICL